MVFNEFGQGEEQDHLLHTSPVDVEDREMGLDAQEAGITIQACKSGGQAVELTIHKDGSFRVEQVRHFTRRASAIELRRPPPQPRSMSDLTCFIFLA